MKIKYTQLKQQVEIDVELHCWQAVNKAVDHNDALKEIIQKGPNVARYLGGGNFWSQFAEDLSM